jgi:hypothetical protein
MIVEISGSHEFGLVAVDDKGIIGGTTLQYHNKAFLVVGKNLRESKAAV